MKKFLLMGIIALFLVGCNSSEPTNFVIDPPKVSDQYYIGLEEAMENADSLFSKFYGHRTRTEHKVTDVEFLGNNTRTGQEDLNGFYIVNYENESGFAILSADRRREAVFALSDTGSLHLADTLKNTGLSWYLNQYAMQLEAIGNISIPVQPIDTITPPPTPGIEMIETLCQPLLKDFFDKFHQSYPYNKYCFTLDGKQAVTGCVPLAIGTVMQYYKWPNAAYGHMFNWSSMYQNKDHDSWSRLFEILGRPENTDAYYGERSTGASPNNIVRTFTNMGYKNAIITVFNESIIVNQLKTKNPVLCGGQNNNGGSHRWVIDGCQVMTGTRNSLEQATPITYKKYYFNCVWGWNGRNNGLFYYRENSLGGTPNVPNPDLTNSTPVYNVTTIVYGYKPNNL